MKDDRKTRKDIIEELEKALRESEEKYRNILENIEEGYYEVDLAGNFTLFNSSMSTILGYPDEEMKGMNNRRYMTGETARKVFAAYNEVYRTGIASKNVSWELIRKDGNRSYVETSVYLKRDSEGQPIGFRGLMRDVTDRRRAEEALRAAEKLCRALAEQSLAGVYVVQDGKLCFINSRALSFLGCTNDELMDKEAELLVHPDDRDKQWKNARAMLRGESAVPYEYRIMTKEGQTRWILETVTSITYKGRPAILGNAMDITDRKRMEEEIISLSITDYLTGLYNRRGFITLAEQQTKIAERTKTGLLLLFADLDKMKWINDNLGHEKGDRALMDVASILKEVFRKSDVIARIGGDEFAVLGVGASMKDGKALGSRLQHKIYIHNAVEKRDYEISLSVGMAYRGPENPYSLDELMSQADARMYEQKRSKRS